MTDQDLQRLAEYLNQGRHLSRIATAAEKIAGVQGEEGALRAIARYSARNSEGANGLKTGFLKVTEDLLFEPSKYQQGKKIVLTEQHTRQILGV